MLKIITIILFVLMYALIIKFDNYKQLKENNDIENISNFSFVLSDMGCCIDLYSNNINEIQQYLDSKGFDIEKLTVDNAVSVLKGLIK